PFMGSEDFAFMLEQHPHGSYFTIGAGDEPDRCMVHNPGYDFNDALLLTGAALWCGLTERYLRYSRETGGPCDEHCHNKR
ncbi:hypothetical protein ACWWKA_36785, partial [Klebsiella quasipneumoniae]